MSTAVLDTDFDTEFAEPVIAPPAPVETSGESVVTTPAPAPEVPTPSASETATQKRLKLMASGSFYRDSVAHQAAAQTWAIVELVEATEKQTSVLAEQNQLLAERNEIATDANAIAERHVAAVEQQAAEARVQTIISLYSAHPQNFPDGVLDQLKAYAGLIAGETPAPEPVAPDPIPDDIDFN